MKYCKKVKATTPNFLIKMCQPTTVARQRVQDLVAVRVLDVQVFVEILLATVYKC